MKLKKINFLCCRKIEFSVQKSKIKSFMITTAVETIVLIIYCAILPNTLKCITLEIKNVLNAGLSKYTTNKAWKIFWNTFQQEYQCCGNVYSTDWFQTAWISPITLTIFQIKK